MLEKRERYDPAIYGKLKSEFLNKLDSIPSISVDDSAEEQEKRRQEIIKEIREGKLVAIRH